MAQTVIKRRKEIHLGEKTFMFFIYAGLFLAAFICVYPIWFTIISSISDATAVYNGDVRWVPSMMTIEAYQKVFQNKDVWMGYVNTIFYTVLGTIFNLLLTIPSAYALSKKRMLGHGFLTTLYIIPMYVGGGLIPTYILMKNLNLLDTRWILVVSGGLSIYNMIVTRTYFQTSVPESLYEAARIDGSSEIGIFVRIAIPLSMPVIAVIALYYASGHWNSYFNAMIYLTDNNLKPLQLVLQRILIYSQSAYDQVSASGADVDAEYMNELLHQAHLAVTMKYALVFIASAPMLAIYPFVQKYFVKGVMIGSVKG
ncbi:MAG: carbohydrate ABC transporter permease [Clostridia bacterium]|nr:carbohydrate ABC transporter permease [Clostridia bacterium]